MPFLSKKKNLPTIAHSQRYIFYRRIALGLTIGGFFVVPIGVLLTFMLQIYSWIGPAIAFGGALSMSAGTILRLSLNKVYYKP